MKTGIHLFYITTVVLFSCFSSVNADDIESFDDIVVSGTRSWQDETLTPGSIRIITAEEIRNSGSSHIVEVLRNQGGVQVSDLYGDGSRSSISMRGFGGNAQANTLILVDGRRLNNADLGIPDINSVSLKDVERIEIIRGSAGVLYGDQAVAGVINIITRKPGEFNADIDTSFGSFNKRLVDIHISDKFKNGLGYRFSGEKSKTDNFRDNNEQNYTNLFGRLEYEYQSGSVFIEYQDIGENLETPGTLFIDQIKANRKQAFNADDFIKTDTRNYRLGISQQLTSNWELQAEYTNRLADSGGLLSFGGVAGPFITKRDHREITPRLIGKFSTNNGPALFTIGMDFFTTGFYLESVLGSIDDEQKQYAAYVQGVIPVIPGLELTLGTRYAEVNNNITGALLPPGTKIDDNVNAFEAGLSYLLGSNIRIFGRIDSNYRFVLADEYTSASFGGVIPDTQTGISYELGLDWMSSKTNVNMVFYRLDINDEIDFDPVLFINTNIGDTRRNGIIVDASYTPVEKLSIGVNYSFVNAVVENGPLKGIDIPFVARHTIKLTTGYQFSPQFYGQAELLGISKRVATGDFFNSHPPLPGYVIGNLNLKYENGPFGLDFRINNVLDRKYSDNAQLGFRAPLFIPETTYFPAPDRNYLLTLSYQFN